jgi:ubiquitin C-terminal hydrolase
MSSIPPDIFAVKLYIPEYQWNKKIQSCSINRDIRNEDFLELGLFLRALSKQYHGYFDETKKVLEIYADLEFGGQPWGREKIFTLTIKSFEHFELQMPSYPPPKQLVKALIGLNCRVGIPAKDRRCAHCLQFLPSVVFDDDADTDHPFDVFRRYIHQLFEAAARRAAAAGDASQPAPDPSQTRPDSSQPRPDSSQPAPDSSQPGSHPPDLDIITQLHAVLFPNLAAGILNKARAGLWRTELATVLSELTKGSVLVLYTPVPNSHLREFGRGRYLFSLTCVFPWAIDILAKRPNCLMTDSTFKCVKPYTLPILHAIIANESIPIAFGISPTETSDSYSRIYDHIIRYHTSLVPSMVPNVIAESRANLQTGNGTASWNEDPETVTDGDDLPEEGYSGPIEEQDASPMQMTAYNRLDVRGLLCSLPILTDQGKALQSFIGTWKLTWKICHRHILESIGADTLFGGWAARLLRCFDEAEWEREVKVVQAEMTRRQKEWSPGMQGYRQLLYLLGLRPDGKDHHLADKAHWALWLREGCPTTTNSAESVNGHLNAVIKDYDDLPGNIRKVAEHLLARYHSRNTWCDRALKRNAGKCFPSEEVKKRPWFSEARMNFYRKLHNATNLTKPVKRRFPPEIRCFRIWPDHHEWCLPCPLPTSWGTPSSGIPLKELPDELILTRESCHTWQTFLGWKISLLLQKKVGALAWKLHGSQIYANVQSIGQELGVPDNEQASSDMEAEWRCRCLDSVGDWLSDLSGETKKNKENKENKKNKKSSPRRSAKAASTSGSTSRSGSAHTMQSSCPRPSSPAPNLGGAIPPGFVGLKNLGNTCYANAVVQVLVHLNPVNHYFARDWPQVQAKIRVLPDAVNGMARAYAQLQAEMERGPISAVSPRGFLQALYGTDKGYKAGPSFDAGELMEDLLELLHADLVSYNRVQGASQSGTRRGLRGLPVPDRSIIHDVFGAQVRTQYDCSDCRKVWNKTPSFHVIYIRPTDPPSGNGTIPLAHCLTVQINGTLEPGTRCNKCREKGQVRVTRAFTELPPVLIFQSHLMRRREWRTSDVPIFEDLPILTFPDHLDMAPYVVPEVTGRSIMYDLKTVVRHIPGDPAHHQVGHFKAYIRIGDSRYCFNDAGVSISDWGGEKVPHEYVSLLIYERVETLSDVPPV